MPRLPLLILLAPTLLFAEGSPQAGAQKPGEPPDAKVAGRWVVTADFYGTPWSS